MHDGRRFDIRGGARAAGGAEVWAVGGGLVENFGPPAAGDWPANGEPTILELLRWKPTVLRGGSTAAAASIEGAASVLGDVLSDVLAALFMARGLRERGSASSATLARPPRRTTQL